MSDEGRMEEAVERACEILDQFECDAEEKMLSRESKYGSLVGDTPFQKVILHLLDELVEFMLAMCQDLPEDWQPNNWIAYMRSRVLEGELGGDPYEELLDVYNLCRITTVCGKVQGVIE